MIKLYPPPGIDPCKMQRGLLFLICAVLLPFAFLSQETNGDGLDFLDDDYEILNTSDIPFDKIDEEDTEVAAVGQRSSNSSTISSVPVISRQARFGLINHNNICYMSAFITASYNVHSFREALYACEPENATTVMIAEVFAKLQTAKSPISTELCLMPSLKEEIKWSFGMFQDNMEFGNKILDMLPKSVKSFYSVAIRTDYYLEDRNDVLLKSKTVPQDLIIIMPVFKSISDSIESRFRSQVSYLVDQDDFHEYEDIIEPFTGKSKEFSTMAEEFIVNRPEIIVFGIGRKNFNGDFNETPMELDFEITLPGLEDGSEPVRYILQSFCYHVPGHYISYARDFTVDNGDGQGIWYQYNDSNVSVVSSQLDYLNLKRHADTGATLAFYVRYDRVVTRTAYREPQVPERIMRLANLMLALEEIQERRREMVIEEKKKQYRSPPAPVSDYSSPKSLDSSSLGVSSPSIVIPTAQYRSSILSDDDKKRSKNIPSPTNLVFLEEFPLDADYF